MSRIVRTRRRTAAALTLAFAAATLAAAPARAGMYFESLTTNEGPQGEQVLRTKSWVEGDSAKIVFAESDMPMMTEGAYLLTTDGGRTLYLVDPEEKTIAEWNVEALLGAVGTVMQGMGPLLKINVSDPKVEKLADEAGEAILGHATRHYRFRTTYTMEMRVMGMGQSSAVDSVVDTWTTTELSDAGFGAWLRRDPPRTGIADLDKLVDAEIAKGIEGVPLRMRTVSTSRDKKGRETTTTMSMEVTTIREEAAPAGAFAMPSGYERVEMPTAGMPFGNR